jgi:hypothetical protein
MYGFALANGVGVALALLDREDVVEYIKKHAKGVPKGLWVDVDRTLRITIYIVAGISVVMLWAATIALCHRRRLIEADEDAFDSYIGLGGDAEPEAYSRGRRYDRLHSDRKNRARRREYPRQTQRYRSNQTATTDAIGGLEGGQGSGFMDSAMSDSRSKHEKYGFGNTREAPISMPKTGNPFL